MDINDLILSKTLRGFYKDPTKIAHKVLADRIGVREPGNKPAINDRIQYIYIKNDEAKLQGDKIETLEFITQNELKPDYLHYITNQIMKPILQLYSLCLTELGDYKETEEYWVKVEEELMKKEMYKDDIRRKNRLENLRLLKVQELLFDEFINKLKEPKIKKERVKKDVIEIIEDDNEIKEVDNEGDMKIIESKVKECITFKIVIKDKKGKIIYKDDGNTKEMTKDKLIIMKLKEIYEKVNGITKIKLNNKKFIKDYKILIAKFKYVDKLGKISKTDVGIVKMISEITSNRELLELKDKIILDE
jgi:hypothetical protein